MSTIDPITLAKIAAACKGSTPAEKVATALAVLRESEIALHPSIAPEEAEVDEVLETQFSWIPFDHWLEGLMPKSKKPDRWARYREFLRFKCEELSAYRGLPFGPSDAGSIRVLRTLTKPYVGNVTIRFPQDHFIDKRDASGNLRCSHLIAAHIEFLREKGVKRSDKLREEVAEFLAWKRTRDAEIRSAKAKKAALKRHRSKRAE